MLNIILTVWSNKISPTSHVQGDDAEGTFAQTLKSFDSNGVTIGTNNQMNQDTKTYALGTGRAGGNKGDFNVDDVGYAKAGITEGTLSLSGYLSELNRDFRYVSLTLLHLLMVQHGVMV